MPGLLSRTIFMPPPVVSAYAAWHQMVPICTEWWCMEANEATQTHCYNPVAPAYPIWAYYAHGWQRRCQEYPVSLPSSRLEKTTRSSPHYVAQHHPTGSETTPPYAPRSSRFGSEPPCVEVDVDVWCYAISELHAINDDDQAVVHPSICMSVGCQTCQHDTLKTNLSVLMQSGTSGPLGKGMEWSTLEVKRSKVKVAWGQRLICSPGGVIVLDLVGRVALLVVFVLIFFYLFALINISRRRFFFLYACHEP